ncbi:MAG TPA: TonB family protein, partial [Polyangiaceae bacterium]|nr:TonB family protein [Polyangiaceae bacterium]
MAALLVSLAVLIAAGNAAGQQADEGAVPRGGPGAAKKPAEEQPVAAKPVVVMPELVTFVDAPYPAEAQAAGLEANVVLKLTIDKDGNVTAADVAQPAGHGFDEAARDAALKFKFKPATRDGVPVPVQILYRYNFTLKVAPAAEKAPPAPTT